MTFEPFIGQIQVFPYNFAPRGWATCSGQLIAISQNTALFAILGTTYGGNGQTTFALPDLRGRVPMGTGQGPGLTPRVLGEQDGQESVTLLQTEMPVHTHTMGANTIDLGDTSTPGPGAVFAQSAGGTLYQTTANTDLAPTALAFAGSSLPHENRQPVLTLQFCIAMQGIFPQRP